MTQPPKSMRVPTVEGQLAELMPPSDADILRPFLRMVRVLATSGTPRASPATGLCFTALAMFGSLTHSEVVEQTGLPKYTVSKALRALETEHVVKQVRSGEERRQVIVSLTVRGRQLRARLLDEARAGVKETRERQRAEARRMQAEARRQRLPSRN